jgi:mono/diheme cytochrome c family protein
MVRGWAAAMAMVMAGAAAMLVLAPSVHAAGPGPSAQDPPPDDAQSVSRGVKIYRSNCMVCHGADGGGGAGPSLKGILTRLSPDQIREQLMQPRGSMARLYPDRVNDADIVDLIALLRKLK